MLWLVRCVMPQLSHVLNGLKFTLAVPGAQILSEGMTQEQVHAAMEQLRKQSTAGEEQRTSPDGQATPLMQAAARRLSQEAALRDANPGPAAASTPAARRLSAEAVATAAVLQEASHLSRMSGAGQQEASTAEEDAPEPMDVKAVVSLAEACVQVRLLLMLSNAA